MAMAQERYKQVHAELHFYETRESLSSRVTHTFSHNAQINCLLVYS